MAENVIQSPKIKTYNDDLWAYLQHRMKRFEANIESVYRRNTGSYFTHFDLAFDIVEKIFEHLPCKKMSSIMKLKILEPCVGTGSFIFAFLKKLSLLNASEEQVRIIVKNIYVVDINEEALAEYFEILNMILDDLWGFGLPPNYIQSNISNKGLIFNFVNGEIEYISLDSVFPNIKFDVVLTNPPYKTLKADKNKYMNDEKTEEIKKQYSEYKSLVQKHFLLASTGVTNLYRLFLEEIVLKYTVRNALVGVLIPNTILSDKTCTDIRRHLLHKNTILEITTMPEGSNVVDANQALASLVLQVKPSTSKITFYQSYPSKDFVWLDINSIIDPYTNDSIVDLEEKEWVILDKIRQFPRIKELDFIHNKRGELDLSIHKSYISLSETKYNLIRGRHLGFTKLKKNPSEWVHEDFLQNTGKKMYVSQDRLVCQQIVNLKKEKRLMFSYIKKNNVVGNSCNFVCVDENSYGIDLYALLGILNSSLMNWFFKLFSSNNHVNNYEIDSFPIPVESPHLKTIGHLVRYYLEKPEDSLWRAIEKQVLFAYGLSSWHLSGTNFIYDVSSEKWSNFCSQIRQIIKLDDDKILRLVDSNKTLAQEMNMFSQTLSASKQDELLFLCKSFRHFVQKAFDVEIFHDLKNFFPRLTFTEATDILHDRTVVTELVQDHELSRFDKKVIALIVEKYQKLIDGQILNHNTFTLSELDMEMIEAIPPGGNWQNIPQKTINKSERLKKIQKTGGRTTLYGRLQYEHPAYTITTYFNRPGNGAYIHPSLNRVLSVREASRLQSFRDSYFFTGNQGELLKQVGNAVPPKLAFHLGMAIKRHIKCARSLDLFCGAGGFSTGLAESGIQSIIATDYNESACITFKVNHPHTKVVLGDLSDEDVKRRIIEEAIKEEVDIVCGGPPCQGFSYAGKRFIDDPRNKMAFHYLDVVQKLQPKIALIENVEGMLTSKNGAVYEEILSLFSKLGYRAEGQKVWTHHFKVPQKRKRVIIIAVRSDIDILPEQLFPKGIDVSDKWITVSDSLRDLEDSACSFTAIYQNRKGYDNSYLREIKGGRYTLVCQSEKETQNIQQPSLPL